MTRALLAAAVVFAGAVQLPITRNYFREDDFLNLYRIANEPFASWVLQVHGGHLLVVRNLLFSLCHEAFGADPQGYLWVAWLTHLVNVALLFCVVRAFTASALAACFGAVLWGTHPLLQITLGWYSVYGQVVAATILLLILRQLGPLHAEGREPDGRTRIGWYALLLVGSTCFGTGIGIALVFPAVVHVLLPGRPRLVGVFASLWVVVPALYALLHLTAPDAGPVGQLVGGLSRAGAILSLLVHLVGFGWASLCYARLGAALLGVGVLLVFAFSTPSTRRRLLACAVLALGCYGVIAAGRADAYARVGIDAAATARSARFHYMAWIPLAILLCVAVGRVGERPRRLLLAAGLAAIVFLYASRDPWIDHHGSVRAETERTLRAIRGAIAAQPAGSDAHIWNRPFRQVGWLVDRKEFPGWAGIFVIFFPDDVVEGRRVYFWETDAEVVAAARRKPDQRIASLLIPAPPPPGGRRSP